jgi:hypothetical protein
MEFPEIEEAQTPKKANKYKLLLRLIVLLIIALLSYFGYNKLVEANIISGFNKSYEQNKIDSLKTDIDTFNLINNIPNQDSGVVKIKVDTMPAHPKSIFTVNKTFDSIGVTASKPIKSKNNGSGLFEELLLKDEINEDNYYGLLEKDIVSTKNTIKIIAIASKGILTNENYSNNEEILNTISEADQIVNISIINRKSIITFSTDKKIFSNQSMDIFEEIDLSSTSINISKQKEYTLVTFPIFHLYGRIGTVILKTKQ